MFTSADWEVLPAPHAVSERTTSTIVNRFNIQPLSGVYACRFDDARPFVELALQICRHTGERHVEGNCTIEREPLLD